MDAKFQTISATFRRGVIQHRDRLLKDLDLQYAHFLKLLLQQKQHIAESIVKQCAQHMHLIDLLWFKHCSDRNSGDALLRETMRRIAHQKQQQQQQVRHNAFQPQKQSASRATKQTAGAQRKSRPCPSRASRHTAAQQTAEHNSIAARRRHNYLVLRQHRLNVDQLQLQRRRPRTSSTKKLIVIMDDSAESSHDVAAQESASSDPARQTQPSTETKTEPAAEHLDKPNLEPRISPSEHEKAAMKFTCSTCDLSFTSQIEFKAHFLSAHATRRHLVCHVCTEAYTLLTLLAKHVHTQHPGVIKGHIISYVSYRAETDPKVASVEGTQGKQDKFEPIPAFECRECDAKFAFYERYKRHARQVHGNVHPFACAQCERAFCEVHVLEQHVRKVHNTEINFVCPKCRKPFFLVHRGVEHSKTCAGPMALSCLTILGCKASFVCSQQWRRHMAEAHGVEVYCDGVVQPARKRLRSETGSDFTSDKGPAMVASTGPKKRRVTKFMAQFDRELVPCAAPPPLEKLEQPVAFANEERNQDLVVPDVPPMNFDE